MKDVSSLSHSVWECKYHVVWIPKYRKKLLYGQLRKYLGQVFKELAQHRECEVLEGHMISDHVHMLVSIPPKYAVAQVVGYIKVKVLSMWPEIIWVRKRILQVPISGLVGTMYLLLDEMKKRSENISGLKTKKTVGSIN